MRNRFESIDSRNRLTLMVRVLIIIFCAAALITSIYSAVKAQGSAVLTEPAVVETAVKASYSVPPLPSYATAIEKAMPSVVFIYTEKNKLTGGKPSFEGGSGVILRTDGLILTNRHVVDDAKKVWVTLSDMNTYEAVSVFPDTLLDLAVVKIDVTGLPAASIGDSDKLRVGDHVIALGNPLGLSPADGISTASAGIVSKRDCSFIMQGVPYHDLIQTDAAISTGSSGGPLVNLDGEVVGINSAHALFAQNVGFAISMNTAKHVFEDLATLGKASHPYLGITVEDRKTQLTSTATGTQRRAIITNIEDGAPSAAAGVKVNDVIISINDMQIHTVSELTRILWRMHSGDIFKVTVLRKGETLLLTVKLSTRLAAKPLTEL